MRIPILNSSRFATEVRTCRGNPMAKVDGIWHYCKADALPTPGAIAPDPFLILELGAEVSILSPNHPGFADNRRVGPPAGPVFPDEISYVTKPADRIGAQLKTFTLPINHES